MLVAWRDRASGYRWLHYQSMQHYKQINLRFVHASILLSAVASSSGFSFTSSDRYGQFIGYLTAAMNVVIGLLNSYQRFGKPAEKAETNGSVAMQYGMLYRLLDTELRLSEEHQRTDLIPFARQEMDRLFANSAMIPQSIIDQYTLEFPNALNKPELCDGMNVTESPTTADNLASLLKTSFQFNKMQNRFGLGSGNNTPKYQPPPIQGHVRMQSPIPPTLLTSTASFVEDVAVAIPSTLKEMASTIEQRVGDNLDENSEQHSAAAEHQQAPSETKEENKDNRQG